MARKTRVFPAAIFLSLVMVTAAPGAGPAQAKDNVASIRVLEKCGFRVSGEAKGFAAARGCEVEEFILELDESA